MSSISEINRQLELVGNHIKSSLENSNFSSLERLVKIQKYLIETQLKIFIECQESDLDMPELPLFVEQRDESWAE